MQMRQTHLLIFVISFSLTTSSVSALDLRELQRECAEIGFKIKTEDNASCVLQLIDKINSTSSGNKKEPVIKIDDINSAQQRILERKQMYERDAEIIQRQHEIDEIRRQQAEYLDLQRRSVAAQEKNAEINNVNLLMKSLEMMGGVGEYAPPPPRAPVTCFTTGRFVTCN